MLIAGTDTAHAESTIVALRKRGHQASHVRTGAATLRELQHADVVLLHMDLSDMDGLDVCRGIRAVADVPVLACAEDASESECVLGLQAGADDYLIQPYGFHQLLARMEAVMRRTPAGRRTPTIASYGPLVIDAVSRRVYLHDREVPLTRKEFDLLWLLVSRPDMVTPRRQILQRIWQDTDIRRGRTIDTHVNSLRRKLGAAGWIVTVRGVGFRLGSPLGEAHRSRPADMAGGSCR